MKTSALIFGHNKYAIEIAKNVQYKYKDISIFKKNTENSNAELEKYNVELFDLSDSWDDLESKHDMKNSIVFCVLENEAENIFLTISLHSTFEDLKIVALAKNKEATHKLNMAGASKVIPMEQTTASIICNMLEKPIVTEVLHEILYEKSNLKIAQIEIPENNCFNEKYPSDIEWSKEHGIIVLSIIHDDMSSEFIYSSKAKHHAIKKGDIFVVIGYDADIKEFEKFIGGGICQ